MALLLPGTVSAAQQVPISFHAWSSTADFNSGTYATVRRVYVRAEFERAWLPATAASST